jgi:hypothetical protein
MEAATYEQVRTFTEHKKKSRLQRLAKVIGWAEIAGGIALNSALLVVFGASKFLIAPFLKRRDSRQQGERV